MIFAAYEYFIRTSCRPLPITLERPGPHLTKVLYELLIQILKKILILFEKYWSIQATILHVTHDMCKLVTWLDHWSHNYSKENSHEISIMGSLNFSEMCLWSCHQVIHYKCITDLCHHWLTHWGRVTHICISKLTIIGSDNGLSPDRRQAIIWTNAGLLFNGPSGTNFSEILIEILTFSFKKMRLKVSSVKRQPFCLGLNVLTHWPLRDGAHTSTCTSLGDMTLLWKS